MNDLSNWFKWSLLALMVGLHPALAIPLQASESTDATAVAEEKTIIPNRKCLKCHDDEEEKVWVRDDGSEVFIYVDSEVYEKSVHGKQNCVGCHDYITLSRGEHEERLPIRVSCVNCHKENWERDQARAKPEHERLGVVMKQIDNYMHSVHARPSRADQTRTNAACVDCHESHNVGTVGSDALAAHRMKNPEVCGKCHEKEKVAYLGSVHGKALVDKQDSQSAVCSDCHTTHTIASPREDRMKLAITRNCGQCHEESRKTYLASYHGQVNRLGYTNTAKCYDCHGSHDLQAVDQPNSKVHPDNRLKTCSQCHENAPPGFLSFHAHGNVEDYERYPGLYITAKLMTLLIVGVFLFFWTHVLLWFYREFRDRQQGKGYVAPKDPGVLEGQVYFRRFSTVWRVIHLLFAVSTMTLVLSGSTLLFAHSGWAQSLIALLGGPQVEAIIHRTAAVTWLSVFMAHFGVAIYNIYTNRKTFRWFGPTSMIPNWQDLHDVVAMFRWFFGKAPRPAFDRWTYWQKFDYWAPFWGAAVIGLSGAMLFAPTVTASFLPGFLFNIATIVHAEEALLATMFLFTVHFFNAHFRPDKFPMSTTIFTGVVPLEEFKHEHALEYERLKASGELEKYLVKAPSRRMRTASNVLGAILIMTGLTLLTLVMIGHLAGG